MEMGATAAAAMAVAMAMVMVAPSALLSPRISTTHEAAPEPSFRGFVQCHVSVERSEVLGDASFLFGGPTFLWTLKPLTRAPNNLSELV